MVGVALMSPDNAFSSDATPLSLSNMSSSSWFTPHNDPFSNSTLPSHPPLQVVQGEGHAKSKTAWLRRLLRIASNVKLALFVIDWFYSPQKIIRPRYWASSARSIQVEVIARSPPPQSSTRFPPRFGGRWRCR